MMTFIVGMNNPLSDRPDLALWPHPPGCAGWRLFRLLETGCGASMLDYLQAFRRLNLVDGRHWNQHEGRERATALLPEFSGHRVVLLGSKVRDCFRLPAALLEPAETARAVFYQLPHPSGRNLWYNDPTNRDAAQALLVSLYKESDRVDHLRNERLRRIASRLGVPEEQGALGEQPRRPGPGGALAGGDRV